MVITCLAILAVDFRIFPRRFAKVETWGTSLMDVGVGSFVFSAGLVSSKTYLQQHPAYKKHDSHQQTPPPASFAQRLFLSLRHSLPLFILGAVRLVSVKNLDYAEHVAEYGVHWNFFFTLSLLPICLALLSPISSHPSLSSHPVHGYIGLALAILYEITLQSTSLKAWALTAPRDTFLSANKEGFTSILGYLSIFLLGMETGSLVLPRFLHPTGLLSSILKTLRVPPGESNQRNLLLSSLALCTALYSLFLALFLYAPALHLPAAFSIPVSRRLANLPYVLWISAFNTGQLLLFALVESFVFPSVFRATTPQAEKAAAETATPKVLEDFNNGGLALFLIANLGTGAVNLGIDTLAAGNVKALGILVGYMALLTGAAGALRGVKLKI